MVTYMKDKNFIFQLTNMEVLEEFTIWPSWEKRGQEFKDSMGQPIKFPIKQGVLMGKDNQMRAVDDIKVMNKDSFNAAYPDYAKSTTYSRDVLCNGNTLRVRFKYSANEKLKELINTVTSLGGNPLSNLFEQTFDKSKSPAQMYNIVIAKQEQQTQQPSVQQPVPPPQVQVVQPQYNAPSAPLVYQGVQPPQVHQPPIQQPITPPIQMVQPQQVEVVNPPIVDDVIATPPVANIPPIKENVTLSDLEAQALQAVKGLDQTIDHDAFIRIMVANGIGGTRADAIFEDHYK